MQLLSQVRLVEYLTQCNNFRILVCQVVLITCQYLRFYYTEKSNTIYYVSIVLIYLSLYANVSYAQISFLVQNGVILKILNILNKSDQDLNQLRMHQSFKVLFWMSICLHLVIPVGPILIYFSKRITPIKYIDNFAYFYPTVIRFILLYVGFLVLMIIKTKFTMLTNYLEQIKSEMDCCRLYGTRTLIYSLTKTIEIHQDLTKACRLVNNMYKRNVFFCLLSNIMESMFAIFFILKDGESINYYIRELILILLVQECQVGILAYIAYETEVAAKSTFAIAGQISLNLNNGVFMKKV